MKFVIYWFRNDLRLTDNPSFLKACAGADCLLPIYIHDHRCEIETQWGFPRVGAHRNQFLSQSLTELSDQLLQLNSELVQWHGNLEDIFKYLEKVLGAFDVYTQQIEAPEEKQDIQILQKIGIRVNQTWQSTMIDLQELPFDVIQMPDVFTQFRQKIEKEKIKFTQPVSAPEKLPRLPNEFLMNELRSASSRHLKTAHTTANQDLCAQLPKNSIDFQGGEMKAMNHLHKYLQRRLPDTYKKTRNQLIGMDYSSKFSPWLSHGCLSARTIAKHLEDYEHQWGPNEGTYWLWFELLWRDYFQCLSFKYGRRLFHSQGLVRIDSSPFSPKNFNSWANGQTNEPLINAGMKELRQTGFSSNRMRQILASYWIYDMKGDWRAGAAWFESQLIDYDVYSNQGNWLYIAGRGTDPRGGRAFNVHKQTREYDPEGIFCKMWQ